MAEYLLSVHSIDGEATGPRSDEEMQGYMERIGKLEEEMKSGDAWVFSARLENPSRDTA